MNFIGEVVLFYSYMWYKHFLTRKKKINLMSDKMWIQYLSSCDCYALNTGTVKMWTKTEKYNLKWMSIKGLCYGAYYWSLEENFGKKKIYIFKNTLNREKIFGSHLFSFLSIFLLTFPLCLFLTLYPSILSLLFFHQVFFSAWLG